VGPTGPGTRAYAAARFAYRTVVLWAAVGFGLIFFGWGTNGHSPWVVAGAALAISLAGNAAEGSYRRGVFGWWFGCAVAGALYSAEPLEGALVGALVGIPVGLVMPRLTHTYDFRGRAEEAKAAIAAEEAAWDGHLRAAYDRGYEDGRREGHRGWEDGHRQGWRDGHRAGFAEGEAKGRQEVLTQAWHAGYERAVADQAERARQETAPRGRSGA